MFETAKKFGVPPGPLGDPYTMYTTGTGKLHSEADCRPGLTAVDVIPWDTSVEDICKSCQKTVVSWYGYTNANSAIAVEHVTRLARYVLDNDVRWHERYLRWAWLWSLANSRHALRAALDLPSYLDEQHARDLQSWVEVTVVPALPAALEAAAADCGLENSRASVHRLAAAGILWDLGSGVGNYPFRDLMHGHLDRALSACGSEGPGAVLKTARETIIDAWNSGRHGQTGRDLARAAAAEVLAPLAPAHVAQLPRDMPVADGVSLGQAVDELWRLAATDDAAGYIDACLQVLDLAESALTDGPMVARLVRVENLGNAYANNGRACAVAAAQRTVPVTEDLVVVVATKVADEFLFESRPRFRNDVLEGELLGPVPANVTDSQLRDVHTLMNEMSMDAETALATALALAD